MAALKQLIEEKADSGRFGEKDRRTYVRKFTGIATSPDVRAVDIETDPRMPKRGKPDPFDPRCYVIDVDATKKPRTLNAWDITVISSNALQIDQEENPLTKPAEITWDGEDFEGSTSFDNQGRALLNTAKDLVRVPFEDSRAVITISKNLANPPADLKIGYRKTINRSSVSLDGQLFRKHELFARRVVVSPRVTTLFQGRQISYRPVQAEIHVANGTWIVEHPNAGFNELTDAAEKVPKRDLRNPHTFLRDTDGNIVYEGVVIKRPILVGEPGEPPTEAQPLDRKGRWIQKPRPDDLLKIRCEVYREANFSTLIGILGAQ